MDMSHFLSLLLNKKRTGFEMDLPPFEGQVVLSTTNIFFYFLQFVFGLYHYISDNPPFYVSMDLCYLSCLFLLSLLSRL